jgi:hypothetical protein
VIELRRKALLRRELWFDEPWDKKGADLLVFYHWKDPVNASAFSEVHSLEIDLTRDSADIFAGFESSTRNQINRAARDGIVFKCWPKPPGEVVDKFFSALRAFTAERNLGAGEPVWMRDYAAQNALLLTQAVSADTEPLTWHSYARVGTTVRQLHSVSAPAGPSPGQKQLAGVSNRYLYWMDILECRKLGIERFDFGGWYSGTGDEKLLRVNRFKEQFGGVKTLRYHSMMPASAKGAVYLGLRKLLKGQTGLVHYV